MLDLFPFTVHNHGGHGHHHQQPTCIDRLQPTPTIGAAIVATRTGNYSFCTVLPLLPPCRRWEMRRKHVRTAQTPPRGERCIARRIRPAAWLTRAKRQKQSRKLTWFVRACVRLVAAVEVAPPEPETGSGKFIFPDLSVYGKSCCTAAPSPLAASRAG